MTIELHDVAQAQLPAIVALNNAATPDVNHLSEERLGRIASQAAYFRYAEMDGEMAAFLLALDQDSDYDSPNFAWFAQRHDRFVYIDRVVVAADHRGQGVGKILYADVESFAEIRAPKLACEVNLQPRNEISLLFHAASGFREVGQQTLEDQGKKVAYLIKPMECYDWNANREQ